MLLRDEHAASSQRARPRRPPCFSQLWNSQHEFRPSRRSLPSQRYDLPATPCPCSPQPFQRWDLGINHRDQPRTLPISWALALSLAVPMEPCQEVWNSPEPPVWGSPRAIAVASNPLPAVRRLLGVGCPPEGQGAHGMGGAGSSRESPGLEFGKSLCPAQCPPRGPHPTPAGWGAPRGRSEPLNPVTGGAVPHCH